MSSTTCSAGTSTPRSFSPSARGLCWFNPLVWLAAAKGSDDLELSCDEVVLAGQDERQRRDYARLLLQSAAEGRGFTTCLSARGKSLRYRLENVLKPRKRRSGAVLLTAVTLAVFLSWGSCAVSTRQGTLGEMAFPQGWESMEIQICLEKQRPVPGGTVSRRRSSFLPRRRGRRRW